MCWCSTKKKSQKNIIHLIKHTFKLRTWYGQPAGIKTASPSFCSNVQASMPSHMFKWNSEIHPRIQILIILKVFKSGVLFVFRSELQKCPSYFFCLNRWNSRWNWWRVLYLYCKTKGNFLTQKVKDNFSPRGISNLWHSTYHIHPLASFCGHLLRRMPDREWDALPANNIMLVPAILLPS